MRTSSSRGFTLIEMLVTLGMSAAIFAAVTTQFFKTTTYAMDQSLINRTREQARTILDMMGYDIRNIGAGMPLGQAGFLGGMAGLGDAPLPVLLSSNAGQLDMRLSERGISTVTMEDFDPTSSLTVEVLDDSDFALGDFVYISDMQQGGDNGFRGIVMALPGGELSFSGGYTATAGAVFPEGSKVARVSNVSYVSVGGATGITRNDGTGAITIAPNATFTVTYRDWSGAALALPLTDAAVEYELASIELAVTKQADSALRDGTTYQETVNLTIPLRHIMAN